MPAVCSSLKQAQKQDILTWQSSLNTQLLATFTSHRLCSPRRAVSPPATPPCLHFYPPRSTWDRPTNRRAVAPCAGLLDCDITMAARRRDSGPRENLTIKRSFRLRSGIDDGLWSQAKHSSRTWTAKVYIVKR